MGWRGLAEMRVIRVPVHAQTGTYPSFCTSPDEEHPMGIKNMG